MYLLHTKLDLWTLSRTIKADNCRIRRPLVLNAFQTFFTLFVISWLDIGLDTLCRSSSTHIVSFVCGRWATQQVKLKSLWRWLQRNHLKSQFDFHHVFFRRAFRPAPAGKAKNRRPKKWCVKGMLNRGAYEFKKLTMIGHPFRTSPGRSRSYERRPAKANAQREEQRKSGFKCKWHFEWRTEWIRR